MANGNHNLSAVRTRQFSGLLIACRRNIRPFNLAISRRLPGSAVVFLNETCTHRKAGPMALLDQTMGSSACGPGVPVAEPNQPEEAPPRFRGNALCLKERMHHTASVVIGVYRVRYAN